LYGREYFSVIKITSIIDYYCDVAYVWFKVWISGHAEKVLGKIKELQDWQIINRKEG